MYGKRQANPDPPRNRNGGQPVYGKNGNGIATLAESMRHEQTRNAKHKIVTAP